MTDYRVEILCLTQYITGRIGNVLLSHSVGFVLKTKPTQKNPMNTTTKKLTVKAQKMLNVNNVTNI